MENQTNIINFLRNVNMLKMPILYYVHLYNVS
jgi:hypothetical protein